MGWLQHILLGDLGQSLDIVDTSDQLRTQASIQRRQQTKTISLEVEIARLKARSERQNLAITALSRFLIAKKIIDESELDEFIKAIDEEDGELDGRLSIDDTTPRAKLVIPPPNAP